MEDRIKQMVKEALATEIMNEAFTGGVILRCASARWDMLMGAVEGDFDLKIDTNSTHTNKQHGTMLVVGSALKDRNTFKKLTALAKQHDATLEFAR